MNGEWARQLFQNMRRYKGEQLLFSLQMSSLIDCLRKKLLWWKWRWLGDICWWSGRVGVHWCVDGVSKEIDFVYCVVNIRFLCQKQVSIAWINNYIPLHLWDVITYPCLRHLLLAHSFWYGQNSMDSSIVYNVKHIVSFLTGFILTTGCSELKHWKKECCHVAKVVVTFAGGRHIADHISKRYSVLIEISLKLSLRIQTINQYWLRYWLCAEHVITWTLLDPVHRRIWASRGLNVMLALRFSLQDHE